MQELDGAPFLCVPGSLNEAAETCCWNPVSPAVETQENTKHEKKSTFKKSCGWLRWANQAGKDEICAYRNKHRVDYWLRALMYLKTPSSGRDVVRWATGGVPAWEPKQTIAREADVPPGTPLSACQVLFEVCKKKPSYTCFGSLVSTAGRWCHIAECRSF